MFYGIKDGKVIAASAHKSGLIGFDEVVEATVNYSGPLELVKYVGGKLVFPSQAEVDAFFSQQLDELKALNEQMNAQKQGNQQTAQAGN